MSRFAQAAKQRRPDMKFKHGMLGILCIMVAGPLQASAASAETTLQRIVRTSEVRIGYGNENPFAYTTPDGVVTGESPEIARKVFARLGVKKVDAVLTEWGGLVPRGGRGRRVGVGGGSA